MCKRPLKRNKYVLGQNAELAFSCTCSLLKLLGNNGVEYVFLKNAVVEEIIATALQGSQVATAQPNPDVDGALYVSHSLMLLYFYSRNGEPLALQFNDVYGPVIPAISFCRNKSLTLRFPPFPPEIPPVVKTQSLPVANSSRAGSSHMHKSHTTLSL